MELYKYPPCFEIKEDRIFINKSYIFYFIAFIKIMRKKELEFLPSDLDGLFKILIISDNEPILICGPSSFKTYLAQKIFFDR